MKRLTKGLRTQHQSPIDPTRVHQLWNYYLPLPAGAAIRHNQLTVQLDKLGVKIEVMTPRWHGMSPREAINGTPVGRVSVGPTGIKKIQWMWSGVHLFWAVWSHRSDFDILHAVTTNIFYTPVLLLAKLLGKPVLIEFTLMQGETSPLGRIAAVFSYQVFRAMDAYIAISSPLRRSLVEKGIPSSRCYLIPYGVDTELCVPPGPDLKKVLRDELGLDPSGCYLIFVGHFIYRKGADILVEMMTHLHRDHDHVQLIVVGQHDFPDQHPSRPFVDKLKLQIKEHNLESYIHMTGLVEYNEVLRWLQASDIFVFPSRREGLGRVILEAMSTGLPCVCSELDGIAYDMIQSGVNGIVLERNCPADFSHQVSRLISDELLRNRMGAQARETVSERFDERDAVIAQKRLYQDLLESRS